jgi:hypothetical protein
MITFNLFVVAAAVVPKPNAVRIREDVVQKMHGAWCISLCSCWSCKELQLHYTVNYGNAFRGGELTCVSVNSLGPHNGALLKT